MSSQPTLSRKRKRNPAPRSRVRRGKQAKWNPSRRNPAVDPGRRRNPMDDLPRKQNESPAEWYDRLQAMNLDGASPEYRQIHAETLERLGVILGRPPQPTFTITQPAQGQ